MRSISRGACSGACRNGCASGSSLLLLHLLLGLPEEQIGADGGAQDGHDHGQVVAVKVNMRH